MATANTRTLTKIITLLEIRPMIRKELAEAGIDNAQLTDALVWLTNHKLVSYKQSSYAIDNKGKRTKRQINTKLYSVTYPCNLNINNLNNY